RRRARPAHARRLLPRAAGAGSARRLGRAARRLRCARAPADGAGPSMTAEAGTAAGARGAPTATPAPAGHRGRAPRGGRPRRRLAPTGTGRRAPGTVRQRLSRRVALSLLSRVHGGEIELVESPPWRSRNYRIVFGERAVERPLRARLRVHSPRFYPAALRGSIGLCESYMDR